ncbi:MAG: S8 family serine peptidase, partial [Lachnospiraceae bacterium]|nr:S8 family serine peptidase [Lachnospiraceae bacterium]
FLLVAIIGKIITANAVETDAILAEEVRDWSQITELIQDSWDESYYSEVTVDISSNEVKRDGKSISLQKEFGILKAEEKQVCSSAKSVEEFFSETDGYEIYFDNEGVAHVSEPYQTCRLYVYADQISEDYGAKKVLHLSEFGEYIFQFDSECKTQTAYSKLCRLYGADNCFLDKIISATVFDDIEKNSTQVASSSTYSSWGIKYMGLNKLKESVQDFILAKDSVTVAVIDTGINAGSNYFSGRNISGYNFTSSNQNDYYDEYNHGTFVAGIIAEATPPNVQILALRIFDAMGKTSTLTVNSALQYANQQDVDVINMSFGAARPNEEKYTEYTESIKKLYDKGIPMIAAVGNENSYVYYPASMPETIAVSWLNENGEINFLSNHGIEVDFTAPGDEIKGSSNTGETVMMCGSSAAAPHVSAAVAMIKLLYPDYSCEQVKCELQKYAYDLGEKGKDNYYGYGVIKFGSYFFDNAKYKLKDVSYNAWYTEAVKYVYENNIMCGTGNGKFEPYTAMTRAMAVQILYNYENTPSVSGSAKFSDVKKGKWYYNAIQWATTKGIVLGVGDGRFEPNRAITREEFVQILYNYANQPEVKGTIDFPDADAVSKWAVSAMTWAVQNDLISGTLENNIVILAPKGYALRAQAAIILMKYYKAI